MKDSNLEEPFFGTRQVFNFWTNLGTHCMCTIYTYTTNHGGQSVEILLIVIKCGSGSPMYLQWIEGFANLGANRTVDQFVWHLGACPPDCATRV